MWQEFSLWQMLLKTLYLQAWQHSVAEIGKHVASCNFLFSACKELFLRDFFYVKYVTIATNGFCCLKRAVFKWFLKVPVRNAGTKRLI